MRLRLALVAAVTAALAGCAPSGPAPGTRPGSGGPTSSAVSATPSSPAGSAAPETAAPGAAGAVPTTRPNLAALGIPRPDARRPAPDLSVTSFDGRTITLGAFRGRPLVVNFFESW